MPRTEDGSGVKAVETTLSIVDLLHDRERASLEELADALDVGTSTVHRHLVTLRERGYVVAEGGRYRLGTRFLTHGGRLRTQLPSHGFVERKVRELSEETGERAQFMVEEGGERVYVFIQSGRNGVRADAEIGKRGPLHASAAGKAILAHLPEERADRILSERLGRALTENTITDRDRIESELETVRERGYAVNDEESTAGLRAVGVPVRYDDGRPLGAMSVSGPTHRLDGDRLHEELPELLRGTAAEIELEVEHS